MRAPSAASNAVDYAKFFSRSHDAVIRVYDATGNVIETLSTQAVSKNGKLSYTKSLDIFDVLRVKEESPVKKKCAAPSAFFQRRVLFTFPLCIAAARK